jgi:hypothetical protein
LCEIFRCKPGKNQKLLPYFAHPSFHPNESPYKVQ